MLLRRSSIDDLATGASFLGAGGGGDPYSSKLWAKQELRKAGPVQLVQPKDLRDDALVAPCGWIGAPTVSMEKLPNGLEPSLGLNRLERLLGRTVDAVLPIEIGGSNGLAAVIAAAKHGVPVIDADGMGRAFPESQMTIFNIRNVDPCPAVMSDAAGHIVTIENANGIAHELIARAASTAMGGIAHMVEYPLTGKQVKEDAIHSSLSTAISIGQAMRLAKTEGGDRFQALFDALNRSVAYSTAGILFDGKITDLERETKDGFSIGRLLILGHDEKSRVEVSFQNENLSARLNGNLIACTPDIISIMDSESADMIPTERLKYGQRVKVVAAAAPSVLRSPEALRVVGPSAFGIPDGYQPVEELNRWNSTHA